MREIKVEEKGLKIEIGHLILNLSKEEAEDLYKKLKKHIDPCVGDWVDWPLPKIPKDSPWLKPLTTENTSCPKCGLDMRGPMGYVCNRQDCPFPTVTYCEAK